MYYSELKKKKIDCDVLKNVLKFPLHKNVYRQFKMNVLGAHKVLHT